MKYAVYDTVVPQDKRQETNEKLLYLIDSGKAGDYGMTSITCIRVTAACTA